MAIDRRFSFGAIALSGALSVACFEHVPSTGPRDQTERTAPGTDEEEPERPAREPNDADKPSRDHFPANPTEPRWWEPPEAPRLA